VSALVRLVADTRLAFAARYRSQTLRDLKSAGFLYDSSAASSMPANDSASDAWWPYTLDHGLVNDCSKDGFCA
jgi:hypothetical protein